MFCPHCSQYVNTVDVYDPVPDVIDAACNLWNVDPAELLSACRKTAVVAARQPIMAVLYHEYRMTLADIGDALDRDHTTVLHGVRVADPDRVTALTAAVTA